MGWLTKVIGGAKAAVALSPGRVGPSRSSDEPGSSAGGGGSGGGGGASGSGSTKRVEWSRSSRMDSAGESEDSTARSELSLSRRQMTSRRSYSSTLVTSQDKNLTQLAAFSPAIAHWELERQTQGAYEPSTWELKVGLLFVDISGFTNLCTRLDIDALQRHINCYFTALIDIVVGRGGDVLRFAGDAIFCAWSLDSDADDAALAAAVHAACGCALELNDKCGSYPIPEIGAQLSIHSGVGVGTFHSFRIGSAERWEFLFAGDVNRQVAEAEGRAAPSKVASWRRRIWPPRAAPTASEGLGLPSALVSSGPSPPIPPRGRGHPARRRPPILPISAISRRVRPSRQATPSCARRSSPRRRGGSSPPSASASRAAARPRATCCCAAWRPTAPTRARTARRRSCARRSCATSC